MASRTGLERQIRALDVSNRREDAGASIEIADDLVRRGLGLDEPAFTEDDGHWRATPLWYCVAHGRNLLLAEHLLALGCDPDHCLWAAAYNDDVAAIDLLIHHGAELDADVEDATPFLFAIETGRFAAAWKLADHGADVNVVDSKGMTALHHMLKKRRAPRHFVAFAEYDPRVDIPDRSGKTAAELLSRKRDPALRDLAMRLVTANE